MSWDKVNVEYIVKAKRLSVRSIKTTVHEVLVAGGGKSPPETFDCQFGPFGIRQVAEDMVRDLGRQSDVVSAEVVEAEKGPAEKTRVVTGDLWACRHAVGGVSIIQAVNLEDAASWAAKHLDRVVSVSEYPS